MLKLLLACLIAPTPPGPPPPSARPHVCKAEGAVVLEIDENKTAVTKLFADGAFTKQEFDDKGKLTSSVGPGCMDDKDLRRVMKEIHAAPFKVQTDAIHCMAISTDITTYKVGGKVVYSERLCGDPLDDASTAALHAAATVLAKLTYDPLTHSPGKPVK